MNWLKSAAVTAAAFATLVACQDAVQDTAAEETAIRAVNEAWDAGYRAGDAEAAANTYAEDAVALPPGAPTLVGREAIREFLAGDIANNRAAGMSMAIDPESTIDVSGDVAWQNGTFTIQDAGGAQVGTGKFLSVLQKRDGKWMLIRDAWNLDASAAPPAPAEPTEEVPAS